MEKQQWSMVKTDNPVVPLIIRWPFKTGKFQQLFIGCAHWDNPKTNQDEIKTIFQAAKDRNLPIQIGGDWFCVMQGKYDPRSDKGSIRPEHMDGFYLDELVKTAVEFLKPFAENIVMIRRGNHETAIMKRYETDLTGNLVFLLNQICKTNITVGGYRGWIRHEMLRKTPHKSKIGYTKTIATADQYFQHGWGGGGAVTKGVIQSARIQDYVKADLVTMEHVHDEYSLTRSFVSLNQALNETKTDCQHIRCGTMKEEFMNSELGWHHERGAPVKPVGCKVINFNMFKNYEKNNKHDFYIDDNIVRRGHIPE